jgi:hypothetical protein
MNIITILKFNTVEKYYNRFYSQRINKLIDLYDKDTFILVSKDPLMISYQYYFFRNRDYGYQPLNMAPILYSELVNINYPEDKPKLRALRNGNILTLESSNDFTYLSINPTEVPDYKFIPKNLKVVYGISGRGFSKIEFEMPSEMDNKKLIFHDGVEWRIIK